MATPTEQLTVNGWRLPLNPGDGGPLLSVAGVTLACILLALYYFFTSKEDNSNRLSQSDTLPTTEGKYSEHQPEVIIVGSGILGSAMAAVLGKDGRKVTIIERDLKEPDRIVGELLQPGGIGALRKLQLEDCLEGFDAHTINGYVIHYNETKTEVEIPFPRGDSGLLFGKAFHHGRFVMALRKAAMAEQNVNYIEGSVSKLLEENGVVTGVQYRPKDTTEYKTLAAPLVIVADGCFSRLRKDLVTEDATVKSHFVGMVMQDCPQFKDHYAELVLTDPSPILIYQISSRDTRILVDVRGGVPKNVKSFFNEHIYPQLPDHLRDAFHDATENSRIKSMPNSYMPASASEKPGVLCLGDAFNMRHPLTGGGMSVALHDVAICRELFREIPDLADQQTVLKSARVLYRRRQKNHSFVVNVLSMALYELFAANNEYLQCLKRACFAYFRLGGECVDGPVSLLSVLNPSPPVLLGHFFAVAMYAVYFTFKTNPWWALHKSIGTSICIFYHACCVLFPLVWSEVKTFLVFPYIRRPTMGF